jgi:malate/lactate dehydrogenase
MNITVIGCGETGATVSALLLSKHKGLSLTILDPAKNISGRILDLQHAAACNESTILLNNFESASKSDYLFFTAGSRGEKGEDRSKYARKNLELIATIFNKFTPKVNALIITISNPTESMSYWISDFLKGRNLVVGTGTGLDTYRLQLIIAKYFKKSVNEINTLVLGEHGSTMTPIWSQTSIAGDLISEIVSKKQLEDFTTELKNSATEIRKTEIATKYGVSQCAVAILSQYISKIKTRLSVSFSASEIEQIDSDNIFISWPCEIGNHSVSAIQNIQVSDSEMNKLKKGVDAINKITNL